MAAKTNPPMIKNMSMPNVKKIFSMIVGGDLDSISLERNKAIQLIINIELQVVAWPLDWATQLTRLLFITVAIFSHTTPRTVTEQ